MYYRTVRRIMPKHSATWAGIKSHRTRKFLDVCLLPDRFSYPRDRPYYESGLIFGLKQFVKNGDNLTIIGGGFGITAVVGSTLVGRSGSVLVYEGSAQQLRICESVIAMNKTSAPIRLQHAIVGDSIGIYGNENDKAVRMTPQELQDCDVLEMDCEGSELGILRSMEVRCHIP